MNDLYKLAKGGASYDEFAKAAKEKQPDVTDESIKAYYDVITNSERTLSDDELANVSGGGCSAYGGTMVAAWHRCSHYIKKWKYSDGDYECGDCAYCKYTHAAWICYYPKWVADTNPR